MNFNKLPKEKRNHLILVVLITLGVLAALGFGLIKSQYESLRRIADKKQTVETDLQKVENSIKHADKLQAELAENLRELANLENGMAPGDSQSYLWIINTLRNFARSGGYKVEIPQFGPSATVEEVNLFSKFPYKQATLAVAGKAHYHDLGRFIADLENEFPHVRVLSLDLKLNSDAGIGEREKLAFTMEFVTLVKPTQ